ncbi:MAG: DUF2905 domain-containing protein [Nitrospiraceae bacterium]|nr:DUF2905 domain-containing protein [Nitrospiraceae bacterium]
MLPELGKGLILFGAVLVVVGLLLLFSGKLPFLGKLPGDIVIKRDNFTFFFPLATSIIVSVVISLILWLINKSR